MEKEEWRHWRHKGIGGSDAPIIMGLSKHTTPLQLYELKILDGPPPESGNFVTERGHRMEVKIRALASMKLGIDFEVAMLESSDNPWRKVSLDGRCSKTKKIITEIKTSTKEAHEEVLAGKLPEKHKPQVHHAIDVADADGCWYISYNDPNWSLRAQKKPTEEGWSPNEVYLECMAFLWVKPDLKYMKKVFEKEKKFWFDHVQKKKPPAASAGDFIKLRTKGLADTVRRFKYLKSKIDKLESELEPVKERLIEIAKEKKHPRCLAGSLTLLRISKIGNVDWKSVPEVKKLKQDYLDKHRKKGSVSWRIQ